MTTSIIDYFQRQSSVSKVNQDERSLSCILLWRRNQLLIRPADNQQAKYLYILGNQHSLIECLKHSPVKLVRIDPRLGEEQLNVWANACQSAGKPIYLRIPKENHQNTILDSFGQYLQQSINCLLACILAVILMPLILPLILWMQLYYHQLPITYEWYVGKRGKLFQSLKFSTPDMTFFPQHLSTINMIKIMQKYGIDQLPQLLNVIRGEMFLFGFGCWTLKDAVSLSKAEQSQLNMTPAIICFSSDN
jgi:hypothetical protein